LNKRFPTLLLAAAAGIGSIMLPMSVGPASAASLCKVEVLSIENFDLQDNDSQDEIKFELGDDEYGTFTFNFGQFRSTSLGSPIEITSNSSVYFEFWEKDSVVRSTIGTRWLTCNDGDHESAPLNDSGAEYILKYRTTHVSS
jgi:hypothetical protein